MIFNKNFLIITLFSLSVTIMRGAEAPIIQARPIFQAPSLTALCSKAFVQGAKECNTMAEYLKPLESEDLDEDRFTALITAQSDGDNYMLLHHAVTKDLASVQTLLDIYEQQEKRFNSTRQELGHAPYFPLQQFVNMTDHYFASPLAKAIAHKKFDIADLLLQKGASLSRTRMLQSTRDENAYILSSLLTEAIMKRNAQGVEYLLKKGVSVQNSIITESVIVSNTNIATIQELQQNQWTITNAEEYSMPPDQKDIVMLIGPHKLNALSLFIQYPFGDIDQMTWSFIEHSATLQEQYDLLHQGLQKSIQLGNFATLKAIVTRAPGSLNNYPYILINVMIRNLANSSDILKLLINAGATINIADGDGNTPLHYATVSQQAGIVRRLIHKNAAINAINRNGETPLDVLWFTPRSPERTEKRRHLLTHGALSAQKIIQQGLLLR